ncbi:MAG TPA: hypothetical protein VMV49_05670, partial [Candidatus Deferrimicrobium sp.]|nr:hypothetical protein [Candidatus Deferrimicrobium sp.]
EYFHSSHADAVACSANSLYTSPGNPATNIYFLGSLFLLFICLIFGSIFLFYFRNHGYQTKVIMMIKEPKPSLSALKKRNLSLKIHLIILFEFIFGIIISLISFYYYTNNFVSEYFVGKHEAVANLVPIVEYVLLIITIPLLILLISFKFKMQKSFLRHTISFSLNLKRSQIPPLNDDFKLAYLPQTFFLIIFIPLLYFFYLPVLENIVTYVFTQSGSLLALQNFIISQLNIFIFLFTLTLLLYLPFKIWGLYLAGRSVSEKLEQPTSDGILMLTASYLLYLATIILLIFSLTLLFFYTLNALGVSFIV